MIGRRTIPHWPKTPRIAPPVASRGQAASRRLLPEWWHEFPVDSCSGDGADDDCELAKPGSINRPAIHWSAAAAEGLFCSELTTLPKESRSPCVGATPGRFVDGGCVMVVDSWCRSLSMPLCNAATRVSHGTSFLAPGSLARRRLARVIHHHQFFTTSHVPRSQPHAGRMCPFRC